MGSWSDVVAFSRSVDHPVKAGIVIVRLMPKYPTKRFGIVDRCGIDDNQIVFIHERL